MKPLLLFWGGGEGGDAAVAIALAAALKSRGIQSAMAAYAYAQPEIFREKAESAGLVEAKDFHLISKPGELWAETGMNRKDFDFIHVHHGRTVPKRTDIVPLKELAGNLPLIITAHGPLPLRSIEYGGLKSKLSRILSPLWFDAVVVPSEAKAREWRRMTPLAKKVSVIPNIVSFLSRIDRKEARLKLEIENETEVALFCSRLDSDKDPFTFIAAVSEAAKARPRIHGLMAGSGELAKECDRLIEELGAPIRRVGYIQDPAPYYAAADVFVQPSLYESFGITMLHAADYGLRCVATDIEVFKDMYGSEESIQWFKPGEVSGCAAAILRSLESGPAFVPIMNLRERFSPSAIVDAHLALWQRILEKKWVSTGR